MWAEYDDPMIVQYAMEEQGNINMISDKSKMITPEQIADAVIYSIEQPEHTMVTSVVIQPNL